MCEIKLVRYRTEDGVKPAIIKTGHKWIRAVIMDTPVRAARVPRSEERFMIAAGVEGKTTRKGNVTGRGYFHNGKEYPLRRAVKLFRGYAKRHGITKGAAAILREAVAQ